MVQAPEGASEVADESLLTYELIQGLIRGRGISNFITSLDTCICQRPYTNVICYNCGHLMFGRVRYHCPQHPMVTFLIDITNCPRCRCFEFMLNEFSIDNLEL